MSLLRQLCALVICFAIASPAFAGTGSDKCVYLGGTAIVKTVGEDRLDLTGMDEVWRLKKSDNRPIAYTAAASPEYRQKESGHPANTKPSLPIADYLGKYESEVYGQVRVTFDGQGRLRITGRLDLNGTLEHWQYDAFRYQNDGGYGSVVQFMVDASHSVSAMQINETMTFWRIVE